MRVNENIFTHKVKNEFFLMNVIIMVNILCNCKLYFRRHAEKKYFNTH